MDRYSFVPNWNGGEMQEDDNGDYVKYDDAMAIINKLLDPSTLRTEDEEGMQVSVGSEQAIAGILILEKSGFNAEYDQLVTWLRAQYKLTRAGATESIEKAVVKGDIKTMIVSKGILVKVVD